MAEFKMITRWVVLIAGCLASSLVRGADKNLVEIASSLEQVAREAQSHESLFENVSISGQINSRPFRLTIKNGKCRFYQSVLTADGREVDSYALDDGVALFTSSGDDLVLDAASGTRAELSKRVGRSFWGLVHPPLEHGEIVSVSTYLTELAKLIREGEAFGPGKPCEITLSEDGSLYRIELAIAFADPPNIPRTVVRDVVMELDSSKKYCMTLYREDERSPLGPAVARTIRAIDLEYSELVPGVFFVREAVSTLERSGADLKARGEDQAFKDTLLVDDVKFGTFDLDDGFFDVHQWPGAKVGMRVHDARFKPPANFIYSEGPFDEAVLNRAARMRNPVRDTSVWTGRVLILGNIAIVVILWIAWLRARSSRGVT